MGQPTKGGLIAHQPSQQPTWQGATAPESWGKINPVAAALHHFYSPLEISKFPPRENSKLQVKDQLTSLSSHGGGIVGGEQLKKGSDSLKDMMLK